MKTYIALFRGINMGGRNLLPMKELVKLLEQVDLHNIRTYIQSGNAVFQSAERSASRISGNIGAAIRKERGFEPQVLVLEPKELEQAIEANPFPEAESEPKSLHLLFLASAPAAPDLKRLEDFRAKSERFKLTGRLFYLCAPEGVGRSKLAANAERLLGVPATGRNWRTVCAIMALAKELQ